MYNRDWIPPIFMEWRTIYFLCHTILSCEVHFVCPIKTTKFGFRICSIALLKIVLIFAIPHQYRITYINVSFFLQIINKTHLYLRSCRDDHPVQWNVHHPESCGKHPSTAGLHCLRKKTTQFFGLLCWFTPNTFHYRRKRSRFVVVSPVRFLSLCHPSISKNIHLLHWLRWNSIQQQLEGRLFPRFTRSFTRLFPQITTSFPRFAKSFPRFSRSFPRFVK